MKTQIRIGVFETNSSSTHSICIVSKEEWESFKEGKLVFDLHKDKLLDCLLTNKENCLTFDGYIEYQSNWESYFIYERNIKGVDVVVFGYAGNDNW